MDYALTPLQKQHIIQSFSNYAKDATDLFRYLNGKINPHNLCVFNIQYFSNANYAQFQAPNLLTIFLGSIIHSGMHLAFEKGDMARERDYVLSIIALTCSHELTHSEQCIDPKRYSKDSEYARIIEDSAEYNAEIFCISHKNEFKELFGFEFLVVSRTDPTASPVWDYKDYILSAIYGVFRCKPVIDELQRFLDQDNEDVAIAIKNEKGFDIPGNVIPIRFDGHYVDNKDTLAWFNQKLMEYRRLICPFDFEFTMYTAVYSNKDYPGHNFNTVVLEVDSLCYTPFLFT